MWPFDQLDGWIADLIPAVPASVTGACAQLKGAVSSASWLGNIVPFEALATGLVILVACVAAAIVIRVLRIGTSVATGGGGA